MIIVFRAVLGAVAAATVLSSGAGVAHATEFDPQPDPPGQSRGFDPQPEPPVRQVEAFNPPPGLNMPPAWQRIAVGH